MPKPIKKLSPKRPPVASKSKSKSKPKPKAAVSPSAKLLQDPEFALSALDAATSQIAAVTDKMGDAKATEIATHLIMVTAAATRLEEIYKRLKGTVDFLRGVLIPDAFEREKATTFTLEIGYRVTVSQLLRASLNGDSGPLQVWHGKSADGQQASFCNCSLEEAQAKAPQGVSFKWTSAKYLGKEAGYWWLRCNDLGDIITETVNASTLSAVARKRLDDGFDMPEEHFNVAILPSTSITKVKSK